MLSRDEIENYRQLSYQMFRNAGLYVTDTEKEAIEVADFGLSDFEKTGLGVLVYVNSDRVCAKELAMLPHQTCPEHRHPTINGVPGKEETFRCRWGQVFVYVPGERTEPSQAVPPAGQEGAYTVWHEIALHPGEQYTLSPDTRHWFQAGPDGAVVSEFSTRSTDENDIFTDTRINRFTQIAPENAGEEAAVESR